MTDEQAAQLKALTNITHYEHSPDSRVLLLAVIEWLNLDEGSPEKWRGLETILFKALSRHRKAASMTNERVVQAISLAEQLKDYLEWTGWHGTSPEPAVYQPTTSSDRPLDARNTVVQIIADALAARERAIWLEAAKLADGHECGGTDDIICQHQNCATIISGMCVKQAEAVKP